MHITSLPLYSVIREHFTKFCDELLQHVPGVCLWAASVHHGVRPLCLEEIKMAFPLRSPSYVVDEVKKSVEIKNGHVLNYSPSEAHTPTDGPVVETITHLYDTSGHRGIHLMTAYSVEVKSPPF